MQNTVTANFWQHKRVFITGHTGFKGSWLSVWLQQLGAQLFGYALMPPSQPNLYTLAHVEQCFITDNRADIRDLNALQHALTAAQPDIVIHLAAQPLVRAGYDDPIATYATNGMGTANLLQSIRHTPSVRAALIISSDKCYANNNQPKAFQETDPLGGHDPYSNSKAVTELITQAFRDSYFSTSTHLASARAGNVIGGGDWAQDRLIPDFIRAIEHQQTLHIRHPHATRPWQHVLEPLSGYLQLIEKLWHSRDYATAWNFGPTSTQAYSVQHVLDTLSQHWPQHPDWAAQPGTHPPETQTLALNSHAAHMQLGWQPRLDLTTTLDWTARWYQAWASGADLIAITQQQIADYPNQ